MKQKIQKAVRKGRPFYFMEQRMEFFLGSGHLSDEVFVAALEACTLPNTQFDHADHVRLAWILVRSDGEEKATEDGGVRCA